MSEREERRFRDLTESFFGFVEDGLYVLIAAALAIGGAILLGYEIYSFASHITEGDLSTLILDLLDGLLLVFIITEIIHTIRVVIDEKVLVSEPFLVVGVVAAIRRLVVVSAEAKNLLGKPEFGDAMLEIGILTGTIAFLGLTIFLLRHTDRSEPARPTNRISYAGTRVAFMASECGRQ